MSNFATLAERNRRFAEGGDHAEVAAAQPRLPVMVITCLDPRTDPAAFLGVGPGDARVLRNAGGRVTAEVIRDVAFMAYFAGLQGAPSAGPGSSLEVAVIHHTKCGTGLLADPDFRASFAAHSGIEQDVLADKAVVDPEATVRADVGRLVTSPHAPASIIVSGHVYDVDTGLITTVIEEERPSPQ